jgi:hypothetical protein
VIYGSCNLSGTKQSLYQFHYKTGVRLLRA